ncbi:hypothetical protein [Aeromonas veronii]|uniref:hypothetical protein n=1 Tax=Aeromonas veronii TaxID=654 RepID=UPI0040553950
MRTITLMIFIIFSQDAFAKDWVFLVSNQDTSIIFNRGVSRSPEAKLTSFLDHVTGRSCTNSAYGVSRTGYISFTGNQSLANQIAQERAVATGMNFYVYRVRGDHEIYNSLATAQYQFNQSPSAGPMPDDLVATLRNEDEYISTQSSVVAAQIQSATVFFPDSGLISRIVINDNYAWGVSSETNSGPYTGAGSAISSADIVNNRTAPTYWNRAVNSLSACFQNMICRSGRVYVVEQANNSVPVFTTAPDNHQSNRVSDIEFEVDCTEVKPAAAITHSSDL